MYAQRSGRTCGNCHESPTWEDQEGWDNPELAKRKCTLSCVACHVDPTGGGLRNSSGRYYGQSTLGVFSTQARSYSDLSRELVDDETLWKVKNWLGDEKVGAGEGRTIPSDYDDVLEGMGQGQTGRFTSAGKPLGGPDVMAFWDGRYGDLNADPAFQWGLDLRGAYFSGTESAFPMQVDLHGAVHPVEHLTVAGTLAGSGSQALGPRVFPRRAFVMAHELPGMSWAKAGVFQPAFGTHIDDHTSFVRKWFEMDVSDPNDTVAGLELGTAPNYPYLTASVFKTDLYDPESEGWGSSVNLGWRDLGWSLTGHGMMKRRAGGRGDLTAAGLGWGLNPAYYFEKVPLTYMGEVSVGTGPDGVRTAMYNEAFFIVRNGLNLRTKLDTGWQGGGISNRVSAGFDVTPLPSVTFTALGRALRQTGDPQWQPDLFLQTHIWF